MELLEGETLQQRLARGPLDVTTVVDVTLAIVDALDAAHGKAILLRDIKPANIFFTAHGPNIPDFGLAKAVGMAAAAAAGDTSAVIAAAILGEMPVLPRDLRDDVPPRLEDDMGHRVVSRARGRLRPGEPATPYRAPRVAPITVAVIWFFTREGHDRRSCETRLAFDGNGYELVVREGDRTRIERFHELSSLIARQQELLLAWQSLGWQGLTDRKNLSVQ